MVYFKYIVFEKERGQMQERYIYISSFRKGCAEILKLVEKLTAMGFNVVYDDAVISGSDWKRNIADQLLGSSCVVIYLTQNAVESDSVMCELNLAISGNKKIIAVCSEDVVLSGDMQMKLSLNRMIRYTGDTDSLAKELSKIDAISICKKAETIVTKTRVGGWICRNCGYTNDGYSRFCANCGRQNDQSMSDSLGGPSSFPGASVYTGSMPKSNSKPLVPHSAASVGSSQIPENSFVVPIRKKSFSKRIKDLLSGNRISDVSFSVLAPAVFIKGNYTMVDVYVYEEDFRHIVEHTKAERSRQEGRIKETDGGHLQVRKGTRITVRLTSPDVTITDNEESRIWTGKYVKFDFPVLLPEEYKKDQLLFCATVYFDGVIASNIRFLVSCNNSEPQRPKLDRKDIHSAFISYASGDRERVALILQGMRRSRPDLDIFFDIETLKSGDKWENILRKEIDRRDILYLCWSRLAKQSPWVEMEWRYALEKKGIDSIEPIPLVLPKDCPPPVELQDKHFSSPELYYQ